VLRLVTDRRPADAGVDSYAYSIDRDSADTVLPAR
jgi:hypothetical protein